MTETRPEGGVQYLEISADEADQRIDNYLVRLLKGVPRSRIYRLLRKGEIRVNKGRIGPHYRLQAGDSLRLAPIRTAEPPTVPVPGTALRRRLETGILLENDNLLVVDKPAGLAVHGGSGVQLGLIEALRKTRRDPYLELVHRLDRGTSGCLMVARNRRALLDLQNQLRRGGVEKIYTALAVGNWPRGLDRIEAPLSKRLLPSGDRIVRAEAGGKASTTRFEVLRRVKGATLLEAHLETGRTHQIRVHCQLAGYPLAGDEKYGDDAVNERLKRVGLHRLFLHARRLVFDNPGTGERIEVASPLPEDLNKVLKYISSIY